MQKQTGLKKILSVIDVGLEFNIYIQEFICEFQFFFNLIFLF